MRFMTALLKCMTLLLPGFICLCSCVSSNNMNGTYIGGNPYWIYKVKLNPDSTFVYSVKAHMLSDSATGTYSFRNDRLVLMNYNFSSKDTSDTMQLANRIRSSFEEVWRFNYMKGRDDSVIFRNKCLYYQGVRLRKKAFRL